MKWRKAGDKNRGGTYRAQTIQKEFKNISRAIVVGSGVGRGYEGEGS